MREIKIPRFDAVEIYVNIGMKRKRWLREIAIPIAPLKNTRHYKKAKVIVMIDETPEEENQQKLAFGSFLNSIRRVDNLTIFSRNDLHER